MERIPALTGSPRPAGEPFQASGCNWKVRKTVGSMSKTEIRKVNLPSGLPSSLFTATDRGILEDWQPKSHFLLNGMCRLEQFAVSISLHRYGQYKVHEGGGNFIQNYNAKWLTDIQLGYSPGQVRDSQSRGEQSVRRSARKKPHRPGAGRYDHRHGRQHHRGRGRGVPLFAPLGPVRLQRRVLLHGLRVSAMIRLAHPRSGASGAKQLRDRLNQPERHEQPD